MFSYISKKKIQTLKTYI